MPPDYKKDPQRHYKTQSDLSQQVDYRHDFYDSVGWVLTVKQNYIHQDGVEKGFIC